MSTDLEPDLQLEIAHVLFMDIVGYSRRPMEEQTRLFRELHHLVPDMPEFRRALGRNELLCLDTGHFHPTETVADKISAVLSSLDEILLHVSRGVRWDIDVVIVAAHLQRTGRQGSETPCSVRQLR